MKLWNLKLAIATVLASFWLGASAQAEPVKVLDSKVGNELHLPVCEWKDDSVETKAVIFGIHGATLYAETFDDVARHLAANGYPVYGLDMRGFGRWQKENDKFGGDSLIHYTQSKADMAEVLGMLRRIYPNQKIFCMGESLGSNMALWLLSNKPELADGAILSSPCIKRFVHPRPRLVVDLFKGLSGPHKPHDMRPHVEDYLSEDKKVTERYLNDPMINRRLSTADLIKSMRTNSEALEGAEKMPEHMPLLVVAGEKDQIYKASAIEPFMKKVGSQQQTILIAPGKGHLLLETEHTDAKILKEIDTWLAKQSGTTEVDKIVGVPDETKRD